MLERIERREAAAASRAAADEGQFLKGRNVHDLRSELEIVVDDTVENLQALSDRLSRLEARREPAESAVDAEFETLRAKARAKTLEGAEAKRFYELLETRIDPAAPVTHRMLSKFAGAFGEGAREKFAELEKRLEAAELKIAALSSNQRRGVVQ